MYLIYYKYFLCSFENGKPEKIQVFRNLNPDLFDTGVALLPVELYALFIYYLPRVYCEPI